MKKILGILAVAIFIQCAVFYGNSFAYVVNWDHWHYYSAIWEKGDANNAPSAETTTRDPIHWPDPITDNDNLGRAKSRKLILKSESRATRDGLGGVYSLSLFYTRMKITGGTPGQEVPSYVDLSLKGVLNGIGVDFRSSVWAGVMVYDYNIGFQNIIDGVKEGDSPPSDYVWNWEYETSMTSGDKQDIDIYDHVPANPNSDQYYYLLAGLYTEADGTRRKAVSDFYGPERYFEMSVTPIPEPATMSLLGLGLFGLAGLRRRKLAHSS